MNTPLNFVAYPAIAMLSLAAAVSAHAQSASDAFDRAAYGATVVDTSSTVSRDAVRVAAIAARDAALYDVKDKSGYGRTPVPATFQRSRTEVRAEAIAAREAGYDALSREGADPQYVVLQRARALDTAHVMAGAPATIAK